MRTLLGVICITLMLGACTTTATIHVPQGSRLYLHTNPDPVEVGENDEVTTRPFFWSAIAGIPYRLEQDGAVVKKGKLRAKFRVASIFWPPFAFAAIYWPVGFALPEYDLRASEPELESESEPVIAPPVPATQFQSTLGRVAVAVKVELPELQFVEFARDKRLATSVTAGNTMGRIGSGCTGTGAGACILAQVAFGLIASPFVESYAEKQSEKAKYSEAEMAPVLGAKMMQDALRNAIAVAAKSDGIRLYKAPAVIVKNGKSEPDYRALAAKRVDTVLEVTLNQIFLEPGASSNGRVSLDPVLPLDMRVRVRLIKTRDNSLLFSDDFSYHGKRYEYSEWAANQGELLTGALKNGYDSLGRDISERIFLLYPFADRVGTGDSRYCGLGALGPKDDMAKDLSPLLSWQRFPRDSDINANARDMKRVKNVRYELVVGSGDNGETPDIFYRVKDLTEASHRLPMKLDPDTRYFWSVRARFKLDGRLRVTDWATSCPFEQQLIVGGQIYRFYTPES